MKEKEDNNRLGELLQSYVNGHLPLEEKRRLEERMEEDPELAAMAAFFDEVEHRDHLKGTAEYGLSNFEKDLQFVLEHRESLDLLYEFEGSSNSEHVDSKNDGKQGAKPSDGSFTEKNIFGLPKIIIGMLFILVLGGLSWHLSDSESTNPLQQIFNLTDPFPGVPDPPFQFGGGDGSPASEQEAQAAFEAEKYARAVEAFRQHLDNRMDYDTGYRNAMRTYLAISLMRQNELEEAAGILKELVPLKEDSIFVNGDIPDFYLGLIYLEQGRYREAVDLLDAVADSPFILKGGVSIGELARRYRDEARKSMTG